VIGRRAFLARVSALMALASRRAHASAAPAVEAVWSGGVHASGAWVKVLTTSGTPVTLVTVAGVAAPIERTVTADDHGVAAFELTGLPARTSCRYTVQVPGAPPVDGAFRTFADGPLSFRVVFASCADTGSTSPVFEAMRRLGPDLFVHMGDLHYEDIRLNDVMTFRRAYARAVGSPAQAALFREVPVAYTWDDHDYGPNNADRRSPSRAAALAAYRHVVPHYPLDGAADATVHQAFTVGRVRFILTDNRSARSPHRGPARERTMLGIAQRAWLFRELADARSAPLVVWVNTIPWIAEPHWWSVAGWGPYADERRLIADEIVRLGLTSRLLMLSGDAHMLAMDDGTHSQYSRRADAPARGFAVAHAAPLDRPTSRKGGPYTHGPVTQNGQFGVLDVTDDGTNVTAQIQGMRLGAPVPGMRMVLPL
jgi:phosphodiesterase/alkaline phosphatase D-like protein